MPAAALPASGATRRLEGLRKCSFFPWTDRERKLLPFGPGGEAETLLGELGEGDGGGIRGGLPLDAREAVDLSGAAEEALADGVAVVESLETGGDFAGEDGPGQGGVPLLGILRLR